MRPACPHSKRLILFSFIFLLLSSFAFAQNLKLSTQQRQEIIRAFLDERAYAHCAIPLGKAGMVIDGSTVSPSEAEVLQRGTAARAGDRVEITSVRFVREGILFEINGGAEKLEKWADRIHVGMGGPQLGPSRQPDDTHPIREAGPVKQDRLGKGSLEETAKGAFLLLKLDDAAGINAEHVRNLLAPVLDFRSTSQAEAVKKNLSPVVAAALKEHRALVGMDRDMVLEAMGRPPRRMRETAEGQEYEEWIYGSPPEEVQFIRFLRGKVVRIEQMEITGEKRVRTENELGKMEGVLDASAPAAAPPAMAAPGEAPTGAASANANPEAPRRKPPTLLRPGESAPSQK